MTGRSAPESNWQDANDRLHPVCPRCKNDDQRLLELTRVGWRCEVCSCEWIPPGRRAECDFDWPAEPR